MFGIALSCGGLLLALGLHALWSGKVRPVTAPGQRPGDHVRREDDGEYFGAVVAMYLIGGIALILIACLRFG